MALSLLIARPASESALFDGKSYFAWTLGSRSSFAMEFRAGANKSLHNEKILLCRVP
jgi:hypothetical protein